MQVYELHRLYRIQKMLMKDIARNARIDRSSTRTTYNRAETKLERAVESVGKCGVPEIDYDDQSDLELTLGPRSFYEKKIKGGEPGINQWDNNNNNSGPSFSSSSSGSSHIKGGRSPTSLKWGPETPVSNQDRLNSPPWLFQALSLNMT